MESVITGSLDAGGMHTRPLNDAPSKEVPAPAELFRKRIHCRVPTTLIGHQGMLMKDKTPASERPPMRLRRGDNGLGPNTDIGAKLRAYYGAVQDQPIPEDMLDLLEELDRAERKSNDVPSRS
jgi:hypothetical protein